MEVTLTQALTQALTLALTMALTLALAAQPAEAVELRAVLEASARHHPELVTARAKVAARVAKVLAREGAFDPKVGVDAGGAPLGTFGEVVAGVGVGQQTQANGLRYKGGWRLGADHPLYQGKQVTAEAGELYGQVELPLWRGRSIDPARAALRRAALAADAERERLRQKSLAVLEKAGMAWIKWRVAAALQKVEADLTALAQQRVAQLEIRAKRGLVADLVRLDNDRLLAARRVRVIEATQATARLALELSLYYRDAKGAPVVAPMGPATVRGNPELAVTTTTDAEASAAEIAAAIAVRPEPRVAVLAIAAAELDGALADNDRAPQLDLLVDAAFGLGEARPNAIGDGGKAGPRALARLSLAWPWPQRKARGLRAAASADVEAATALGQLWRERIAVEVRVAHLALVAARDKLVEAQKAAAAAHALEQAEWRRFDLGQGDLVVVNLREVATADAEADAVKAWGELQAARLGLMVARAELLSWLGLESAATAAKGD